MDSSSPKPNYFDPSTWSDELVLLELKYSNDGWTELVFTNPEDRILPYSEEQALAMQAFYESRLRLAEPEAKKRGLI